MLIDKYLLLDGELVGKIKAYNETKDFIAITYITIKTNRECIFITKSIFSYDINEDVLSIHTYCKGRDF